MKSLADPEVFIALPLSAWQEVLRHLGRAPYDEVQILIAVIGEQAVPQVSAAQQALAAFTLPVATSPAETSRSPVVCNDNPDSPESSASVPRP